jgi:hypothetical protein
LKGSAKRRVAAGGEHQTKSKWGDAAGRGREHGVLGVAKVCLRYRAVKKLQERTALAGQEA